jgi:RNA polymerase sigma-70 factor, ECF subfamily
VNRQSMITDLMGRYGNDVLHLAYSYVKNRQTAEDLAQEIFIKCYEKLDTFEGNSAIQTWLYRIASNHCKDYLKSWHYRKISVTEYVSSLYRDNQDGPEQVLLKKTASSELLSALFMMPVKYREIIFLYYYHEFTQKKISEICGLNLNTVKSRMARAKELLKKTLVERGVDYDEAIQTDFGERID